MPAYDGQIRVVGRTLRGWLARTEDPYERVPFELVIDGDERGYYVADRPFSSLEPHGAFGDGVHGFQLQMDRGWITGAGQTVRLDRDGVPTGVEIHAPLGPAAGKYFDDENPPKPKYTREEAAYNRELADMRIKRLAARTAAERAETTERYLKRLDEISRSMPESRYAHMLAREAYNEGRYADSVAAADRALAAHPDDFSALMFKGRALIAMNRPLEAREVFKRAYAINPDDHGARFYMRTSEALSHGDLGAGRLSVGAIVVGRDGMPAGEGTLAERVAPLGEDWLRIVQSRRDRGHAAGAEEALNEPAVQQAGCVVLGDTVYWRRDALVALAESGLITRLDGEEGPAPWRPLLEPDARTEDGRRSVALIVPTPANPEIAAFAERAARRYSTMGYEPAILRASDAPSGVTVSNTAADLRRTLLTNGFTLVHTVSGLGYTVADALAYTNVPFIYGVHTIADLMEEDDGTPTPRAAFGYILSRATMVYAASGRMFALVEQAFDVRLPVVSTEKEFA